MLVSPGRKILHKKDTLVCNDAAHTIWGPDILAVRSVRGVIASTKASGEEPKQSLTPEKIGVILGMFQTKSFASNRYMFLTMFSSRKTVKPNITSAYCTSEQ